MQIVRVSAAYKEGGHSHQDYKLVLVCGIDKQRKVVAGEWMGYAQNGTIYYPFIFKANEPSEFLYGGEENYSEPTNLSRATIEAGALFTVFNPEDETPAWESTYEIVSFHAYVG